MGGFINILITAYLLALSPISTSWRLPSRPQGAGKRLLSLGVIPHLISAEPWHSPARRARQFLGRELYRQPTRGGFSTFGAIVTIHRGGLRDRSSWTARTMPKILNRLNSALQAVRDIGRSDSVELQRG